MVFKALISSRKSQVLQCDVWDWDPGMGIQNDDYLGRSVPIETYLRLFGPTYSATDKHWKLHCQITK